MVATGVAMGSAPAWAQTQQSAPAATGAPMQLLAPLPNATVPPSAAIESKKIEPPARLAAPPVAPPSANPVVIAKPAAVVPPSPIAIVNLPPAQPP